MNEGGGPNANLNCVELLANQPADVCTPYIGFVNMQFTRGANGTTFNFLGVVVYDSSVAGQGLITTTAPCGTSMTPACSKVLSCSTWDGSGTCEFATKAAQCFDINVSYTLGTATATHSGFIDPSVTQVQIDSNWSVTLNGNSPVLSNGTDTWTLSCQVTTQDN